MAALARTVPVMTGTPAVFDAVAASYNPSRRRLIPPFEAFYRTAIEALRLAHPAPTRVLDLGAGTGVVSAFVRAEFPDARLTLLDGAPKMLAQARDALGADDVTYLERDLADPLPDGPWDAVVSALAIHHLDDSDKLDLYRRIHAALGPGGCSSMPSTSQHPHRNWRPSTPGGTNVALAPQGQTTLSGSTP